jgi:hypothetical protein
MIERLCCTLTYVGNRRCDPPGHLGDWAIARITRHRKQRVNLLAQRMSRLEGPPRGGPQPVAGIVGASGSRLKGWVEGAGFCWPVAGHAVDYSPELHSNSDRTLYLFTKLVIRDPWPSQENINNNNEGRVEIAGRNSTAGYSLS